MLRIANLRHRSLVEAEFRIMLTRDEATLEDPSYRRFYSLKLDFDRLIVFPAALTCRGAHDARRGRTRAPVRSAARRRRRRRTSSR